MTKPTDPPEELDAEGLAHYGKQLHALVGELTAQIADAAAFTKPVDLDEPIGRISRIDAIAVQQMAREGRRRLQDRLRAVKAALERLERDDFGFCLVCDEPIGRPRLDTRPESPACVRCQSIAERS